MTIEAKTILEMNAFDADRDESDPRSSGLLSRRRANFGAASVLFYQQPIEMASGEGCWMTSRDGEKYLDFYNNVLSVGHSHPKVIEAVSRQMRALNVNTRYLNDQVETYLERLKATFPPSLSNVVLSCSGSEANDLALRTAAAWTGKTGYVVTETAYHGNTRATTEISPSSYRRGRPPGHIVAVPAPSKAVYGEDVADGFAAAVLNAVQELQRRDFGAAAFICDSVFSSDGVFANPAGFLKKAVDVVRTEGGLYIADEVQPGFARTGDAMWGFARHGLEPDIVTMGKPMGNGFPISGMATRPELLARFCEDFGYFNTFGGNPVASAAGMAVLEVIDEEGLQENARTVGAYLRERLEALQTNHALVSDVRGAGLFIGVDICREADAPAPDLATTVINGLKDRGVLIGAAGKYGHTLKVRPPLRLSREEADVFVDALDDTLASA